MEITDVKIFPVGDPKLRAFVSIVFDRCFMVNDIRVIEGKQGLFISMPNRKRRNGEFKDVAHPLNQETRRRIEERILAELAKLEGNAVEAVKEGEGGVAVEACVGTMPEESGRERSLEEVHEAHLRDSFWSLD